LHHVERDVCLEQRSPHLAQRSVDVGLRQRAAPRQLIENATKPIGELSNMMFKHLCAEAHRAVGRGLRSPGPVGKQNS